MDQQEIDNAQEIVRTTRTWSSEREPSATEWALWFQQLGLESATRIAGYMLHRQQEDLNCALTGHLDTIASLEKEIIRLRPFEQKTRADAFNAAWNAQKQRQVAGDGSRAATVNTWLTWFAALDDDAVTAEVLSIIEHGRSTLLDDLRALIDRITDVLGVDYVRSALATDQPIDRDQQPG